MSRFRGTRGPFDGTCGYCGRRCYGEACNCHRDLVQLERDLLPRNTTEPTAPLTKSAAGSDRKEG